MKLHKLLYKLGFRRTGDAPIGNYYSRRVWGKWITCVIFPYPKGTYNPKTGKLIKWSLMKVFVDLSNDDPMTTNIKYIYQQ
jgi:hypothetical protein